MSQEALPPDFRHGIDDANPSAADGDVDLTLIRANLALSPAERLRQNDRCAAAVDIIREGGRRYYAQQPRTAQARS